ARRRAACALPRVIRGRARVDTAMAVAHADVVRVEPRAGAGDDERTAHHLRTRARRAEGREREAERSEREENGTAHGCPPVDVKTSCPLKSMGGTTPS